MFSYEHIASQVSNRYRGLRPGFDFYDDQALWPPSTAMLAPVM